MFYQNFKADINGSIKFYGLIASPENLDTQNKAKHIQQLIKINRAIKQEITSNNKDLEFDDIDLILGKDINTIKKLRTEYAHSINEKLEEHPIAYIVLKK